MFFSGQSHRCALYDRLPGFRIRPVRFALKLGCSNPGRLNFGPWRIICILWVEIMELASCHSLAPRILWGLLDFGENLWTPGFKEYFSRLPGLKPSFSCYSADCAVQCWAEINDFVHITYFRIPYAFEFK